MRETKKKRLEAAGWKVGSAEEFLGLSPEETEFVELRLRLAEGVRARREKQRVTQVALAARIGSSQSRVAKMESGDPSVTVDLMVRALLAVGASRADLARLIAARRKLARPAARVRGPRVRVPRRCHSE
jgi:DNA-binding XRE family transcriptional regulator